MKNDIKLQVFISSEVNEKLITQINKKALRENKKAQGVSEYVRNLIIRDLEKNNE